MGTLQNIIDKFLDLVGATQHPVDLDAILDHRAATHKEELDWRHSIVDLLKVLDLDSSESARDNLAEELGYTGAKGGPDMSMWLHAQVIKKLREHGGTLPEGWGS